MAQSPNHGWPVHNVHAISDTGNLCVGRMANQGGSRKNSDWLEREQKAEQQIEQGAKKAEKKARHGKGITEAIWLGPAAPSEDYHIWAMVKKLQQS